MSRSYPRQSTPRTQRRGQRSYRSARRVRTGSSLTETALRLLFVFGALRQRRRARRWR